MSGSINAEKDFGSHPAPRSGRRIGQRALTVLLLASSLALLVAIPTFNHPFQSEAFYGRVMHQRAPGFTLTGTDGRQVSLDEFRGRFVFLMFGYLNCDRVCHSQALTFHMLNSRLRSDQVQFLYLGMDPQRDTAERVKTYFEPRARQGESNFLGLIAKDMPQAQRIAADYHAEFSKAPSFNGGGYQIDHPGFIYLIDPDGMIRLIYSGANLNPNRMLEDLQQISEDFNRSGRR